MMKKTTVALLMALALWLEPMTSLAAAAEPAVDPVAAEQQGHVSVGQRLANTLRASGLPDSVTVFLISTLPIVELRGSIPVGIVIFKMNPLLVFVLSVLGNMLPIPFILLLLGPISRFCMRFKPGRIFFDWLFKRTKSKTASVEKYETLGLTVFVAIPLPATGGWTGAMLGFLLGLRFHHSMWSIFLGVAIAGVIMTVLSLMGWVGAAIAGIALTAMVVGMMSKWLKKEEGGGAAAEG